MESATNDFHSWHKRSKAEVTTKCNSYDFGPFIDVHSEGNVSLFCSHFHESNRNIWRKKESNGNVVVDARVCVSVT